MPILSSSWSQQPNSQRKWRKELNQFSSAPLNNNSLSPVHPLRDLPLILWRSSSFYLFSWRICPLRVWSPSGIHICSFQRCSYTFRFPWCKAFLPPHTRLHLKAAEIKIWEHPVKVKSKIQTKSKTKNQDGADIRNFRKHSGFVTSRVFWRPSQFPFSTGFLACRETWVG